MRVRERERLWATLCVRGYARGDVFVCAFGGDRMRKVCLGVCVRGSRDLSPPPSRPERQCVCAGEREKQRDSVCMREWTRDSVCVRERKRASVFLGRLKYGNKSISDNPAMCATLACFAMLNAILPCLMIVGAGHRMRSLSICFCVRLRERGNLWVNRWVCMRDPLYLCPLKRVNVGIDRLIIMNKCLSDVLRCSMA